MKNSRIVMLIPVGLAAVGAIILYAWLGSLWPDAANQLQIRLAIPENSLTELTDPNAGQVQGSLVKFDGVPADIPGSWSQFRGPNLDAISPETISLAKSWPEEGPKLLWSVGLGRGYAGAAVRNGRVHVVDYDEKEKADAIRCFSLGDGEEIWRYSYHIKIKLQHGMSRTIPTVTDKYLIAMGPKCHVTCLDPNTGEFHWLLDLVRDYGATVPDWYAGQCPLVEDGKLILGVGGKSLMMAVDCNTGDIIWQTPNPKNWLMTHSSVTPVEFAGRRMYVYCASGGVVGVSAEDGRLLWEAPEWQIKIANVPTPVYVGDGKIFLCGAYNAGSMMLQLSEQGDGITAEPLFQLSSKVYGSPQQTPVFYKGHLYAVNSGKELCCLDLEGNVLWTSTSAKKFGLGPYAIADGVIYVLDDDGMLTMAEATPSDFKQLDQAKVLEGPEAWAPMAFVSGRLIVRDMNRMVCLDITDQQDATAEK